MPEPSIERLKETADKLVTTAERFYRLARGATDRQVIETLLRLAEECERHAEELRTGGNEQG